MGQVIFVVARESIEALLIIGILYAWLGRRPDAATGRRWILGGVLAGLGLATLLALTLMGVTTFLGGAARTWFEIGMLAVAAALIVQMVMWMRSHGRTLRRDMENDLSGHADAANWWGVFLLTAIAVGREGAETVMFLYGTFLQLDSLGSYLNFVVSGLVGFALAMVLFVALQMGSRFISWKWFFRVTEVMLLLLAGSLFLTATDKVLNKVLSAWNLPGWIYATVWDSSAFLSDSSGLGSLMAALFGYRSQPIVWNLLMYVLFWGVVWALFRWQKHSQIRRVHLPGV
ncbi:MAG: FTR1 family protein [Rhodobacteraceae bacterium]|nr:FTR1 family protein [Paracoccaceae bacterium]